MPRCSDYLQKVRVQLTRSGQAKNNKICTLLLLRKACSIIDVREKTGWLGIRIMCLSGATYLPADWFFLVC